MLYDCILCGAEVIRARSINNIVMVLDHEPAPAGELVLADPNIRGEPRAIYGGPADLDVLRSLSTLDPIEPAPRDMPRYRIHHCAERN